MGGYEVIHSLSVYVCVCLCVPGLLCDIVENPPKRFPVGLHYQAALIDQLFHPTSCLTSSPSTRLPLPHSSQSHESPLPRRGQGLDWGEGTRGRPTDSALPELVHAPAGSVNVRAVR